MEKDKNLITVEVVYANAKHSKIIKVQLESTATIHDAIIKSNIQSYFKEINLAKNPVGIFSRIVSLHDRLHDGDRIEIYRSLIAEPKQQRKIKAKQQTHLRKP